MEHEISIINKSKVIVSAVNGVEGFDENQIVIDLQEEGLIIYGENLHIEGLDLDNGVLTAAGKIDSLTYTRKKKKHTLTHWFKR